MYHVFYLLIITFDFFFNVTIVRLTLILNDKYLAILDLVILNDRLWRKNCSSMVHIDPVCSLPFYLNLL